jgi:hypothetical protein
MVYDASARVVGFGAAVYQAPTLRLDRVCLDGGVPRTTAPTTDLQPSERSAACSDDVHLLAEPWPEADQLFRRDPRWRGGDGAWSIDLGNARSLWIFGDSFIDPEGETRESSFFIRNSIAIQQGADPTTADMTFYWQTTAQGQPTAYFPNSGNIWYWGGAGAVIDNKVVLFQQGNQLDAQNNVVRAPTRAVLIGNYTGDPSTWTQQWYDVPPDPSGYIWGPHYAFTYGSHLYVYATRPPAATGGSANTAALLRFTKSNAKVGNFTKPQWWTGSQYVVDGQPATLWDPSTQYSVHALPSGEHLAIMGGIAYGPGLFATAPDRSGPFSPFQTFYVPPESSWGGDGGGVLNYLWHAHPQLTGAPVVATYSTHGLNVLQDESPYYPKFVRFTPP